MGRCRMAEIAGELVDTAREQAMLDLVQAGEQRLSRVAGQDGHRLL